MSPSTSSADPPKLFNYAQVGACIALEVLGEIIRLVGALDNFVANCTEYRVPVSHLPGELGKAKTQAEEVDQSVWKVGTAFLWADSVVGTLTALLPGAFRALRASPFALVLAAYLPLIVLGRIAVRAPGWLKSAAERSAVVRQGPVEQTVASTADASKTGPRLHAPTPGRALSQVNPYAKEGNRWVLGLQRREDGQGKIEEVQYAPRKILTVRDHIHAFGCLMTCYTMMIQDRGADVDVVDLYKAKYGLDTGKPFDETVHHDDTVVMFDLNTPAGVVSPAAGGQLKGESHDLAGATDAAKKEALAGFMNPQNGSVAVKVVGYGTGDHWVVVDRQNADGTYDVRDPMKGLVPNASIGSEAGSTYRFGAKPQVAWVAEK